MREKAVEKAVKKGKIDYWLFTIVLVLCFIGLVMVLSASQYIAAYEKGDSYYYFKRQLFNISVGLVVMFVAVKIDYRIYGRMAWPIMLAGLLTMALMMFTPLGLSDGGQVRWLRVGPISLQPSEVMKLSMLVLLCKELVRPDMIFSDEFYSGFIIKSRIVGFILLIGLSCGVVVITDLGSAFVMAVAGFLLLFIGGIKVRDLAGLMVLGVAGLVGMIAVEPYRIKRLTSFLDPWANYYDGGYQVAQSLLAIGSGGLMGVGLGQGGAKWYYLPERHTDFIFAIVVEEGGLLLGGLLIFLFAVFAWRGLTIAMRVKDMFGRLMATGLTLMIVIQALVNIAITLGMLPVTGITLPFISYGGTSLVISLASIGVLLNISKFAEKQ